MSEVRARVQKKLEALKARGTKRQPKNKKRKRVEDKEDAEADGEETGGQASKRKKQVVPEKEKRVTRSEAAKSVERPQLRRLVKRN
jgi:hypothetical protein